MLNNESVSVTGHNNTLVKGNLYNNSYPINEHIRKIIREIDGKINGKIKIYSSTQSKEQDFSSEKMLLSLFSIGIPIDAGIKICQGVESHFSNLDSVITSISTTEIRSIICSIIYRLKEEDFGRSTIKIWGGKYIRTYGHPEQRIIVLHKNGSQETLDFRFLKDDFLPHVISQILGFDSKKINKIMSKESISEMAEEILSYVKSLNLYNIRYKTLFHITYDIAVQPPHPWFSEQAFMSDIIKYDLSKSANHINNFQIYMERNEVLHYWHACIESVRHSCSAVLGFYGCYMGTKEYSPLTNLINVLQIYKDNDFYFWSFLKIKQIEGDLLAIESNLESFCRILIKINQQIFINDPTIEKCNNMALKANDLHEEVVKLITNRDNLENEYHEIKDVINIEKCSYISFCTKVISCIPGIKINNEFNIDGLSGFWIFNKINAGIYAEIKSKILVCFLESGKISNNRIDTIVLKNAFAILREGSKYALTIIFIYNGYIEKKINISRDIDENLIVLDKVDIFNIYQSDDRVMYLEDLILKMI